VGTLARSSTREAVALLYKLRTRLTYANVMATSALFIALGGSSYAAITVTGKSVKDSSLTGRDVKNSSLTGKDVKNRSLLAVDFKAGQLPAGAQGSQGPQGPRGATGDPGAKGDPGDTGAPGTARAYAAVNPGAPPDASFDTTPTSGFTAVSHPNPGIYCLTPAAGISPSDRPAVVSFDWDSTASPEGNGVAMRVLSFCPAGTFGVLTERRVGDGDASNADNIGFSIIVP
jgi:hypothetical protein